MPGYSTKAFPGCKSEAGSALLRGIIASVLVTFLAGCQTYQQDPLDPAAHDAKWRARSASSEEVRTFAKRIAQRAPEAVVFDPSNGLSLREGEIVALVYNPDLRVARLRAGVAKATADHAGRWDDPELAIDVLKITESVPNPWIVGSSLSFTIPISGRLEVEKARADAALQVELERIAEAEWEVRRDLRKAWLSWSAHRLRLQEAEVIVRDLDSIVRSTSELASAGELPKTEAALFSIERERRRGELAQSRGKVAEEEQLIRSLMGLSPAAPVQLIPELVAVGEVGSKDGPDRSNLTLSRLRAEHLVAEHTLLREIRKQYPDLAIGPQGESDQGQSRIGVIGAIPVPILNSNKGGIAKARAEREVARAAYETEHERMGGKLARLRARRQGVRARRKSINDNLVPMVDRQVADARRLLELGEGGSLVLLESLVRAHEAKLTLIDIKLEDSQTNNEIRFLIGPEGRASKPIKTK